MKAIFFSLAGLVFCPSNAAGYPVREQFEHGIVKYDEAGFESLGVARPRLLSATGSVTEGELLTQARRQAENKLLRLFAKVRFQSTGHAAEQKKWLKKPGLAMGQARIDTLHFSDGTIHVRASLPFSALLDGAPQSEHRPPAIDESKTIHISLGKPLKPSMSVSLLMPSGAQMLFGPDRGRWTGQQVIWRKKSVRTTHSRTAQPFKMNVDKDMHLIPSNADMMALKKALSKAKLMVIWQPESPLGSTP